MSAQIVRSAVGSVSETMPPATIRVERRHGDMKIHALRTGLRRKIIRPDTKRHYHRRLSGSGTWFQSAPGQTPPIIAFWLYCQIASPEKKAPFRRKRWQRPERQGWRGEPGRLLGRGTSFVRGRAKFEDAGP